MINMENTIKPEKTYPKGTTKEQWDNYELEMIAFNRRMQFKELYFGFVCEMLKKSISEWPQDWKNDPAEMALRFQKKMQSEYEMSRSCDEPNKPGYYRANND